jgi:hypothetical protein
VPAKALKKVTKTTPKPFPICANKGPGQAPVIAQPNPKISPPMGCPQVCFLSSKVMGSPEGFELVFFYQKNRKHPHQNRCSDNPVHKKRIQSEHFLYPKPADNLRFHKNYPEHYPDQ